MYFSGASCQTDTRPCSKYPCMNDGVCADLGLSFTCTCQSIFYGTYCENKVDLCLNSSCVKNQGKCFMNGTEALCSCFQGYAGLNCESLSESLKVTKTLISLASILAFVILSLFVFGVILMDCLKYFVIKDKRIRKDHRDNKKSKTVLNRDCKKLKPSQRNKNKNHQFIEKTSSRKSGKMSLFRNESFTSPLNEPIKNDDLLIKYKALRNNISPELISLRSLSSLKFPKTAIKEDKILSKFKKLRNDISPLSNTNTRTSSK